ncbi:MAG TPA: universal stress protein [Armatimonadota bacterium]|jgi:nucleotide-binding universal stress UspA family protein
MYSNILVPLDGSKFAEDALAHATGLAKVFASRITVIFVIEPLPAFPQPATLGIVMVMPQNMEQEIKQAEEYLACITNDLKKAGVEARLVVTEGDPAAEICDYGKENEMDLIVMSTHGRSGIRRWVYGSVAERVLREAHSPILLVRSQVPD